MQRTYALSFFFVFSVAACGGSSATGDGSGSSTPQKACTDTADGVAKAAQRCGQDYQTNYDAFVQALGGCDNVIAVRDEGSLRGTCLPSLQAISCADLLAGNLDASCRQQLEHH
jgi:hypothetical protein